VHIARQGPYAAVISHSKEQARTSCGATRGAHVRIHAAAEVVIQAAQAHGPA